MQPGDCTERELQRTPRQPGAMGDAVSPAASADMGDGENEGEDGQHEESTVADEAQALLDKFASVQTLKVCSLVALCRTNSKALTSENFEQDPNDPAVASDTLVQAAALFEREEAVFRDTCSDSFSRDRENFPIWEMLECVVRNETAQILKSQCPITITLYSR